MKRFAAGELGGRLRIPYRLPINESFPFWPVTLYSKTKVEAEAVVRGFSAKHGIEWTIVRPTIVYGPGDRNGMLDKMVRMMRAGSYRIVGDGRSYPAPYIYRRYRRGHPPGVKPPQSSRRGFSILAGPETITLQAFSET